VGYFEKEGGKQTGSSLVVKLPEWNGKTINPQDLVPLAQKKAK
jgi:hypothetical protein